MEEFTEVQTFCLRFDLSLTGDFLEYHRSKISSQNRTIKVKPKALKLKCNIFPALLLSVVFFVFESDGGETYIQQDQLSNEYYVVIGTYYEEPNALKHMQQARLYVKGAGYFFNNTTNSYYVFAYKSGDKYFTLKKLHELRANAYFKDAWYYKHRVNKVLAKKQRKKNDLQATKPPPPAKGAVLQQGGPEKTETIHILPVTEDVPDVVLEAKGPIVNASEPHRDRPKNDLVADSRSHTIPAVTTDFVDKSAIDQLQTAKSGDVIIFNNLLFHRNAAILQRSSESDLNKLLGIMLDNANMKIKIHGHTNGDFRGEIVTMGKKNKDYFQANSKNNYVQGDAVLLSIERAKIISKYLKEKGVLASRIQVQGWGGQKTIYPLNSTNASLNSRVEIEILEK